MHLTQITCKKTNAIHACGLDDVYPNNEAEQQDCCKAQKQQPTQAVCRCSRGGIASLPDAMLWQDAPLARLTKGQCSPCETWLRIVRIWLCEEMTQMVNMARMPDSMRACGATADWSEHSPETASGWQAHAMLSFQ